MKSKCSIEAEDTKPGDKEQTLSAVLYMSEFSITRECRGTKTLVKPCDGEATTLVKPKHKVGTQHQQSQGERTLVVTVI